MTIDPYSLDKNYLLLTCKTMMQLIDCQKQLIKVLKKDNKDWAKINPLSIKMDTLDEVLGK